MVGKVYSVSAAARQQQQQQGVHPVRWSGGVVLFLRIMGPSDDPVLLGLDIVKEGRPLPQDEVRMFLAKPQFSLDHELVVETLITF